MGYNSFGGGARLILIYVVMMFIMMCKATSINVYPNKDIILTSFFEINIWTSYFGHIDGKNSSYNAKNMPRTQNPFNPLPIYPDYASFTLSHLRF